jgi:hypothetical protein
MPHSSVLTSLRRLIAVDALTCAAMGVGLLVTAGPVAAATEIPAALLFYAGLSLVPVAAFMAVVAAQPVTPPMAVGVVVAVNVLWVAASVLLLLGGWIAPNALGFAFVAGQALVVAVLVKLEFDGWRTSDPRPSVG